MKGEKRVDISVQEEVEVVNGDRHGRGEVQGMKMFENRAQHRYVMQSLLLVERHERDVRKEQYSSKFPKQKVVPLNVKRITWTYSKHHIALYINRAHALSIALNCEY